MGNNYLDIIRDKQFVYFCQGCLEGKIEEQMSKRDTRYCLDYQPVIEEEYALVLSMAVEVGWVRGWDLLI